MHLRMRTEAAGDTHGEARWRLCHAYVSFDRSDLGTARLFYERTLPLFCSIKDALGEALCILSLGDIAFCRFDLDAARTVYEVELPLHHSAGNSFGKRINVGKLGAIGLERSQNDAVRAPMSGLYRYFAKPARCLE